MTKPLIIVLLIFELVFTLASCDRPSCKTTNPVFDSSSPQSQEYKSELAKQLKLVDRSELSYWVGMYRENAGSQFIHTYIQGDGLCAVIVLKVEDSQQGIQGILKTKGKGYRGAELKDLKFNVRQDSVNTEFVFKSVASILD